MFMYVVKAATLSYACVLASGSLALIIGLLVNMTPDDFAVYGLIFTFLGCAVVVMLVGGIQVKSFRDCLNARSTFVWLPTFLGVLLSFIWMFFFWLGIWLSLTFAFLNTWHYQWSESQTGTKEV